MLISEIWMNKSGCCYYSRLLAKTTHSSAEQWGKYSGDGIV